MVLLTLVLVFIIGLCVGSFLSAYTYRLFEGKSATAGRSFCPKCKKKIHWFDNIPLLSFILLEGKCRSCDKKISWRYPVIELSTAILFTTFYYLLGKCPSSAFGTKVICLWKDTFGVIALPYLLVVLTVLVAIFVIDFEHQMIPDFLVYLLFILTFSLMLFFFPSGVYLGLLTASASSLFLLLINLVTRGRGMGLGDVKFALFGGLILGWPVSVSWFFLSFVIGAVVGLILILIGKASFGKHIPFGPFLVIGLIIALIWGDILQIGILF